jgi:hypothetical protein
MKAFWGKKERKENSQGHEKVFGKKKKPEIPN